MDRPTRSAEEIAHMNAKIAMSLEAEEDIQQETESAISFRIIYQTGISKSHDSL